MIQTTWTPLDAFSSTQNLQFIPCATCAPGNIKEKSSIQEIRGVTCPLASFLLLHFTSTYSSAFEVSLEVDLWHAQSSKKTLKELVVERQEKQGKSLWFSWERMEGWKKKSESSVEELWSSRSNDFDDRFRDSNGSHVQGVKMDPELSSNQKKILSYGFKSKCSGDVVLSIFLC